MRESSLTKYCDSRKNDKSKIFKVNKNLNYWQLNRMHRKYLFFCSIKLENQQLRKSFGIKIQQSISPLIYLW